MSGVGDGLFEASMENAKTLSGILKAVQFQETVTCFISPTGIKVTAEQAKSVQANAFVKSELFQTYSYNEDTACAFRINLNALIECLSIFAGCGNDSLTSLKLSYDGYGHPLQLILEDNGIVTECSIVTQEADEVLDFDFTSSNVHSRLIIKSECLKEAFAEIDFTNNVLEMIMSPNEPNFKLITNGYIGTTQFDFCSSSEMIEVFECKKTQRNKYKLALLKPSIKGLHQSSKVSVRMDTRGFLSLQCMVITDDQQICFIEYLCVPAEDDEV